MMNFGYPQPLGRADTRGRYLGDHQYLSSSASNEKKLIWTLAVVLLPVLGLILWFFLGPRDGKA